MGSELSGLEFQLAHLFGDPGFEFFEVDGWEFAEVGSEPGGFFGVDVLDVFLWRRGVPLEEDADASFERAGDADFV